MQQALPFNSSASLQRDDLKNMASQNPVIVFGLRGCCMICVINNLLHGQGVNPAIFEIDVQDQARIADELQVIAGNDEKMVFPVVFIGGKFFGGVDQIMAAHINGELVPALREARALWL